MVKKKPTKKATPTKSIKNRRASHDFTLDDSLLVGIVLSGAETKALRNGRGQLRGAYVTVKDGELWLLNATISSLPGAPIEETAQTRSRKLLAKRKEIDKLIANKQQGQSIIPLEILTKGRYIKVRIAGGKGKKHYDKRQNLKARDASREAQSAIKQRVRS